MNRVDHTPPTGNHAYYMPNWKYFPMYRQPPSPPGTNGTVDSVRAPLVYDVRAQLPVDLPRDPRHWSRQDVQTWLQWCQEEFDLPPIDVTKFTLNGKALCLLLRADFTERAPSAGDVLFNTIQILLKEVAEVPSPYRFNQQLRLYGYTGGTLTSAEMQVQTNNMATTTWPVISSDFHNLGHVLHQPRVQVSPSTSGVESTVTLSPAPSTDSQKSDSPRQQASPNGAKEINGKEKQTAENGSGHSSEFEDSGTESPLPTMVSTFKPSVREQEPMTVDTVMSPCEPITNGRLLWDFLHQLLNDPAQRYSSCIRWKDHETGVFKITDPNGLARLWGMQKNHLNMNFDKMSRALRYYYRVNILRKVQGERHCYQFLRQPTELKAFKQRALLSKFRVNDKPIDMSINSTDLGINSVSIKTEALHE